MFELTTENVESLIGKKIRFTAPAYRMNKDYEGVCIIKSVDYANRKPLKCECLEGDDLSYAFLEDYGTPRSFAYTDSGRTVFVEEVK